MDPQRTKIIACATVMEEILPILPAGMSYEILDFGLHRVPGNLRTKLQAVVDASGPQFDTLLLGYGLCSMALVGLRAGRCTLAIPRVDDCIAIFLGSRRAYLEQAGREPGTYFLTKGWIEVADTPLDEYQRTAEKYGPETAAWVMETMLKNYTRLAYIDTGRGDQQRYVDISRRNAEQLHLRFEQIPGSNRLIRKLLDGPWDEEILVVPPGGEVAYSSF